MASTLVAEITLISLKPDASVDEVNSPAHDAVKEIGALLKKTDGCEHVFFGRQLEDANIGVLAISTSHSHGIVS
jgi:hypothetical protein